MPHRNKTELIPPPARHSSLQTLAEDDEEDGSEFPIQPYTPFRTRPSFASTPPSSSRASKHGGGSNRKSNAANAPKPARTTVFTHFNSRYRRTDEDDPYYFSGQNPDMEESDDDDGVAHPRGVRPSANGPVLDTVAGGLNGVGVLDTLSDDEHIEPKTAEDMARLEWQTMLVSVLNGDVLRSEKTRIGRVLESYEAQRINRLELWQELRAKPRGRTVEQEKEILEERRRRMVPPLIEEIMNFRVAGPLDVSEQQHRISTAQSTSPALRSYSSSDPSPLKQVASLLRRWDGAEALYPNLKAMRQDQPECGSEKFIQRLDTLNTWFTVINAIRRSIDNLKNLTGSESLDVSSPHPDNSHFEIPLDKRHAASSSALQQNQSGDRPQQETSTFVERILKEDGLQRTFERGALVDLHGHVHNARYLYLNYSEPLREMNLPSFTEELVTIISFPTRLMERVLRVRLDTAKQMIEQAAAAAAKEDKTTRERANVLSVDQLMEDFHLAIGLACTLKNDYEGLIQPDNEGLWNLPPCIGTEYEDAILLALRFFFKLIHQKLKSAHRGIYFKETELLETQWRILEEVTIATKGGGLLVAEHVCSLTNKLILRVISSFQGQIKFPAYAIANGRSANMPPKSMADSGRNNNKLQEGTAEDKIRWFSKVLEGVRLRHRKLQRYSRLLLSRFGNSAEYTLDGVATTEFVNGLVGTEHFLVYTEYYESQGIYIIGDPSLYNSPDSVRQMLWRAFRTQRRNPANLNLPAPEESEDGLDSEEYADTDEGQYLLVITPQDNFVWSGVVLVLSMPEVQLDMEDNRARLIASSAARLPLAKQKFAAYFVDEDEELEEDEEFEPPLQVISEQQAHLPPVNRELKKIARATQKLAEVIVDSVHEVKEILASVPGAQEVTENWFMYASEHGQAALRSTDHTGQLRLSRLLTKLSISWVAFICDDCDPSDRKTFRWAVNALEFAMVRTRGTNILQLSEEDFKTLQQKVASCMTLLVSHFDILGARSSYEEREKEKERQKEESVRFDEGGGSIRLGETDDPQDGTEGSLFATTDRSVRGFFDRVMRGLQETDKAREAIDVEQHIAGRVLMNETVEDDTLAFLASTASKTQIRWQQGRFIAAGAFGSVYLAMNLETGNVMAAKEIRFKNSTSLSTLYQQVKDELAVMEILEHPNIVQYYGLEVHRDKVYIFEEYCSGGTLTQLLESGRIEDETVVKIYTMQMLEGLMYLHSMGVVHRDIKPDNILLDHNGILKLVDFGAAKILTKTKGSLAIGRSLYMPVPSAPSGPPGPPGMPMNSLTGTPMYMSPEVIKSDRRSRKGAMDIWSMGCVVLEMVTGRKPWSNLDNEWAIMFHIGIATQHPPLPEPGQLSSMGIDFIRQCLSIDGMKRPTAVELYEHPWMIDFREELRSFEEDHPTDLPPTPSLVNSSVRTEFSEMASDAAKAMSPGTREKIYDTGLISPPGPFSEALSAPEDL
ncbi:Suppressor of Sensor Kinase (SLN1) [Tulasnella sp. 424]|nr:Suppressor of Sensor Kinase (SLN1) [Tulasnella sp. 424]KAG8973336.1 Suppressor of Sensor Kinase (SLN1) [Tulasnella sp. 425]